MEESLREFENMKNGKYAANEATLRMKMDMLSPNPNMWDQVRLLLHLDVVAVAHCLRCAADSACSTVPRPEARLSCSIF